jgi:hypothetical protein
MFGTRTSVPSRFTGRGLIAALTMLVLAVGAAQYAPAASARGFHGGSFHGGFHRGGGFRVGGAFIGGAIIGSALASSYYYGPSYYGGYYPPAYYPPAYYPPPAPVTYVEQQPDYASAPPPSSYAPQQQQQLSMEQRAQRLKAMCAQGLFTPQECAQRRAELLRGM